MDPSIHPHRRPCSHKFFYGYICATRGFMREENCPDFLHDTLFICLMQYFWIRKRNKKEVNLFFLIKEILIFNNRRGRSVEFFSTKKNKNLWSAKFSCRTNAPNQSYQMRHFSLMTFFSILCCCRPRWPHPFWTLRAWPTMIKKVVKWGGQMGSRTPWCKEAPYKSFKA